MLLKKRGQGPPGRRRSMNADGCAVTYELRCRVAWIGLNRPQKRNAINDALLGGLLAAAQRAQEEARALVVFGHGPCFCAGLDLAEHRAREPAEVFHHSRSWHAAFSILRRGRIPAIAALQDRKSTRLNSSHANISDADFCL